MARISALDAVALLKADHRRIEALFAKFEIASGEGMKANLADQICMALTIHTRIEEDVFYPACKGAVKQDTLMEAYVEHDSAKVLIGEIEAGSPNDALYDAKVKVLSELVAHHVEEEEKHAAGLFSQARDAGLDMDALGERLAAEKKALSASYKIRGLPVPETPSFEATTIGQAAHS